MRRLAVCVLLAFVASLLAGCSNDIGIETVKDKDKQRREVAKTMPGNDVPVDPADRSR